MSDFFLALDYCSSITARNARKDWLHAWIWQLDLLSIVDLMTVLILAIYRAKAASMAAQRAHQPGNHWPTEGGDE